MTEPNHYTEGQTVELVGTFKKYNVATDPDTITLKVKDPSSQIAIYTYSGGQIVRESTGRYSKAITFSIPGLWHYRWIGTGDVPAVTEKSCHVITSQID